MFTRLGSMDPRTPLPADMTQAEVVEMIQDSLQAKPLVPGEPDYHVLDGYEIECGGTGKTVLYLDAYHCSTPGPGQAPAGFRIAPQG
ncbi:hypothetical protein MNQ95_08850 [Pseudoxanthomonas daejeonensis]|uniref:hypothetical protein n=1 Tax=Pseudoxanthomonas daejeonensis TaxID=266062 RepID=UPI001F543909|nr:hypothetical protein [Pseudoxanthomonas daejeonensis]UNK56283.1 hypothetical protein MNQ95_08850 [Pseudoxanthomonas daejeonensis]